MTDAFNALRRLTKLAWAILYGLALDRPSSTLRRRAEWQQRQAKRMLRALETRLTVSGTIPAGGLMVCNHLGYLDVVVIATLAPLVFVSKSDVARWPVIGRLLESAGTILAERRRPLSAATTAEQIREVLDAGVPVVLFPEGTSSDGSEVLPFMPSLLQAALDAGAPVTPAAIFYQVDGGDPAHDVCYWGDHTFFPHLIRLARLRKITAHLVVGEAAELPAHRKAAAKTLHAAVAALIENALAQADHR